MTDRQYARKLAREYGITDASEIAAIEVTIRYERQRVEDRIWKESK